LRVIEAREKEDQGGQHRHVPVFCPVIKNDLQGYMHTSQGSKASRLGQVRQRPKEVPDLRDIHQVGWTLVSVLWVQAEDKAKELEVQGKAAGQSEKDGRGQADSGPLKIT
jgi:hypothetical protein